MLINSRLSAKGCLSQPSRVSAWLYLPVAVIDTWYVIEEPMSPLPDCVASPTSMLKVPGGKPSWNESKMETR